MALELLATVVSLMVFFDSPSGKLNSQGLVTLSGFTDSSVATHVVGRALTTSYPLCLVAMEAAIQMERLGLDLRLLWTPRHLNEEAYALSNIKFAGFDPKRRANVDVSSLPFVLIGSIDKEAHCYYIEEKPKALAQKGPTVKSFTKPADRLREKDPW